MQLNDRVFDLDRPKVMGILNVTPDSFSDGGRYLEVEQAIRHAEGMIADGADILDIGGESTRPGAATVSLQQELGRVVPVIEAVRAMSDIPISVDTSKAQVMRAAIDAGANIINDVYALQNDDTLDVVARSGVAVCLMHMQGEPGSMQVAPRYDDVVAEVIQFLEGRLKACREAGINKECLLVDPGFGFGKTLEHNLALLRNLDEIAGLGVPVLVGMSRKKMIRQLTGNETDGSLAGNIAAAVLAATKGASILRVHDVKPTVEALKIVTAMDWMET